MVDIDSQGEVGDTDSQEAEGGIDAMEVMGDVLVEEVDDCRCYSSVDGLVEVVLE